MSNIELKMTKKRTSKIKRTLKLKKRTSKMRKKTMLKIKKKRTSKIKKKRTSKMKIRMSIMTKKRASRMKKKTMPKPLTIMNIGKEVILPVKMARSISIKNNALKSHWKISRNFMTIISYDMLSIKCQKDNLEICLYEVITFKRISCKVCHKTFSPNRRLQIHIERNHKSN